MKKSIIALFLLLSVVSLTQTYCLNTLEKDQYTYSYWEDGADTLNWADSDFKCYFYGYDGLVIIADDATKHHVADLMSSFSSRSWIGMSDLYKQGYWYWNDGTKVSMDHNGDWATGEPSHRTDEDCGVYYSPSEYWYDRECDQEYGFICAKASNSRTALDNSEYVIGDVTSDDQYDGTLAGARQRCTDLGFRLAEVTSDKVVNQMKKNSQWNSTTTYWIDGPNQCLNSDVCTGKLPYICEAFHPYDIKLSSHQKDYEETEVIRITCTVSGLPVPKVTWYKNHERVRIVNGKGAYQESEPGKSTLLIENAKLDDSARYRCYAENDINGDNRTTYTYTDIRVHPKTMEKTGNGFSAGGSAARSLNTKSMAEVPEKQNTVPSTPECEDWSMASWMLPTIFAFNIMILLAIGVLMCNRRSPPTKSAGNEFTNYAVYSTNGKNAGQE